MSLKKKKLAKAMSGMPLDYTPPPPETLAQIAAETWQRNCDTLVANFIMRNPELRADEIELVTHTDEDGMHFHVRKLKGASE